jgi:DNA-directed RNA polymerase
MGNFNRGSGFGGGRREGGRPSFGGGRPSFRRDDRGPVTMTKVTCDECHKACEVPFRPTAGKPVYCNDCFRGQNAGGDRAPRREFNDRPQAPRSSFTVGGEAGVDSTKKQLELLNTKMDKLISAIEVLTLSRSNPKTEIVKTMTVSIPKKEAKKEVKKKSSKK